MRPVRFNDVVDKKTGGLKIRKMDISSEYYEAAASYMIRLRRQDIEDESVLKGLADTAGMPPKKFLARFKYLV